MGRSVRLGALTGKHTRRNTPMSAREARSTSAMFPAAHPGVAYLLYAVLLRASGRGTPTHVATGALVVGALLPDVVDQSLYHVTGAVPSTRTLAHSLLVVVPVCVVVIAAIRMSEVPDDAGYGFAVGYLSHPLADALWPFVSGEYAELGFLLWPITPSPPYTGRRVLVVIADIPVTTRSVELGVLGVALIVWWSHGRPGLRPVRDRLSRRPRGS